jgi:hypothetical protein
MKSVRLLTWLGVLLGTVYSSSITEASADSALDYTYTTNNVVGSPPRPTAHDVGGRVINGDGSRRQKNSASLFDSSCLRNDRRINMANFDESKGKCMKTSPTLRFLDGRACLISCFLLIDCRQRRSGNMRAERERPRGFTGVMIRVTARLGRMRGIMEMAELPPIRWGRSCRMHGDCMT